MYRSVAPLCFHILAQKQKMQAAAGTTLHKNSVLLYKYSEVPPFLQGNPHIKSGYRAFLSYPLCLRRFCLFKVELGGLRPPKFGHIIGLTTLPLCVDCV